MRRRPRLHACCSAYSKNSVSLAVAKIHFHEIRKVADTQLGHETGPVQLHGFRTDAEDVRNALVEFSGHHQLQYLALTAGEYGQPRIGLRRRSCIARRLSRRL